jgi:hypothetical protein
MDTTFFQKDGSHPHTVNVVLDILHVVFGRCVVSKRWISRVFQAWMFLTTLFTGHEFLQLFILGPPQTSCTLYQSANCSRVASENWRCYWRGYRWLVARQIWQICGSFAVSSRGQNLILNMCSHEEQMRRNSPWKWAFIHVSYASVS